MIGMAALSRVTTGRRPAFCERAARSAALFVRGDLPLAELIIDYSEGQSNRSDRGI